MKTILILLAFCALPCFGDDPPLPASKMEPPPGLEGLVWNKWDTPNFIVISLDKGQGFAMRSEAESLRSSLLERWSLKGSKRECKLVCVPDSVMLKRLFGLSEPRSEVRKSDSGTVQAAIWIDIRRKGLLPSLLAEAELLSGNYSSFAVRGIPVVERSPAYVADSILSATDIPFGSIVGGDEKVDIKSLAGNSALLCLLVRKEFGADAFGRAASTPAPWSALGFSSEKEFASTFARYRSNLLSDLKSGRTPEGYLGARP